MNQKPLQPLNFVFTSLTLCALTVPLLSIHNWEDQAVAAPAVVKSEAEVNGALSRYQMALDQLALGDVTAARVIAEDARKRLGDTPEINLLLGYLLQREGRIDEAQARLNSIASSSALANRFAAQLGSDPKNTLPPMSTTKAENDAVTYISGTPTRIGQSNKNLAALEQAMIRLVNAERTKAGLGTLIYDATLADVARAHSVDMRDRDYFAHEAKTAALREPIDRYRAVFKKTPAVIAENVYRSWGSPRQLNQADIQTAHDALMNSSGHRANILIKNVTRIGIGIIVNPNGDLWVTQMFART